MLQSEKVRSMLRVLESILVSFRNPGTLPKRSKHTKHYVAAM